MYGHLTRLSLLQVVFWLSFSLGLQLRSEFLEYWTSHILLSRLIEILFSLTFGLVSFSFSTLAETWDRSFHNQEIFVFSKKKKPSKNPYIAHFMSCIALCSVVFTSSKIPLYQQARDSSNLGIDTPLHFWLFFFNRWMLIKDQVISAMQMFKSGRFF